MLNKPSEKGKGKVRKCCRTHSDKLLAERDNSILLQTGSAPCKCEAALTRQAEGVGATAKELWLLNPAEWQLRRPTVLTNASCGTWF